MSLNVRQERFAKRKAAGATNREAYRDAEYQASNENSMDANASRLLRNDKVIELIQKERIKLEDDERFKVEAIADRLHKYELALANEGNMKQASEVAMNEAKLAGHLVDKTQDVSKLTDEQLQEELEKLRKQG